MSQKTLYYIAAIIGSILGGLIPNLWGGGGLLSISSLVFSAIGAIICILIVYKFL